jgi:O-antigen/teichoic acid export membrane protein
MTDNKALKSKVLHSLKWVALGKATTQILRWILTFWVIRILTPEDYGIVAIADILFSLLMTVAATIAISPLIQAKQLEQKAISSYFGVTLAIYSLLFCCQYLLSDSIAALYNNAAVADVLKVNAWCFLLLALETVPSALLRREMAFKKLALIYATSNIVAAVSTLLLAIYGFGFWALVYGEIIAIALRVVMLLINHPAPCLPSFRIKDSLPLIRFGGLMSILTLLWYAFLHLDVAIGGLLLTTAQIGIFTVALNFALMPQKKILPLIKEISFPAFSQLQDQPEKITHFLIKAQRLGLMLTLPVFWGLASICNYMLPVVIGDKWNDAIVPTILILILMPLRFSEELFQPAAKAQGHIKYLIINTIYMIAFMAIALFAFSRFGATGLAVAWLCGFPLAYLLVLKRYSRLFKFSVLALLQSIGKIVLCAGIMVGVVSALKLYLQQIDITNLLLLISAGAISYVLGLLLLEQRAVRELRQALSSR